MAYAFSSSGNYFTATRNYNVMSFTAGLWVYRNSALTGTAAACWTNDAAKEQWLIQINNTGTVTIAVRDGVANTNRVATSTGTIALSTWRHVALVKDSASITCFINGTQDGQSAATNALPSRTDPFAIGNRQDGSQRFDGNLAEFATWTSALTAAELGSLAKGFKASRIKRPDIYIPLIREVIDTTGAYAITTNGTPAVASHPRVY